MCSRVLITAGKLVLSIDSSQLITSFWGYCPEFRSTSSTALTITGLPPSFPQARIFAQFSTASNSCVFILFDFLHSLLCAPSPHTHPASLFFLSVSFNSIYTREQRYPIHSHRNTWRNSFPQMPPKCN